MIVKLASYEKITVLLQPADLVKQSSSRCSEVMESCQHLDGALTEELIPGGLRAAMHFPDRVNTRVIVPSFQDG